MASRQHRLPPCSRITQTAGEPPYVGKPSPGRCLGKLQKQGGRNSRADVFPAGTGSSDTNAPTTCQPDALTRQAAWHPTPRHLQPGSVPQAPSLESSWHPDCCRADAKGDIPGPWTGLHPWDRPPALAQQDRENTLRALPNAWTRKETSLSRTSRTNQSVCASSTTSLATRGCARAASACIEAPWAVAALSESSR